MLPGLTVPASLAALLQAFRSCFRLRSFEVFCLLVVGMIAQTGACTITGMLVGAGMQAVVTHDRLHRFFSTHAWSADQLGLVVARLIVAALLPADAALDVAVDDSLFRRRGKQVHGAFWTHDASQPGRVTARGNRWVIVGIVVTLPFGCRPTCLPVLFRLWGGKGATTPVELARTLVGLLARAFPDRAIHLVADAAYHGKPLQDLPARVTWTTRIQRNAVLDRPAPPPTGRRGRPRTKGDRIGTPAQAAAGAAWRQAAVARYGRTDTVHIAEVACLWYGAFGKRTGRLIAVAEGVGDTGRQLLLFTTNRIATAEQIVARYAARWSIEVAIETAKGPMGVGQARNRVQAAVERTVPFGMLTMSLVYCWDTRYGHHPDDVTDRRARQPWYTTKTEPSFEDMLAKLRRTIIAARFLPEHTGQPTAQQINAVHRAWASAAV
jgi:DDE superfamily endonuclease